MENKSSLPPKKTSRSAKRSATGVKKQIKKILKKSIKKEIFYYEQRQLVWLTLSYALISFIVYVLCKTLVTEHSVCSWATVFACFFTMFFSLSALVSALFVTLAPQKLAVITENGIKIDHNPELKWSDVSYAEEKLSSPLTRRPIISLIVPSEKLKRYKLTFMQKLCKYNTFTPFSIPLYAMTTAERDKIRVLIKQYVKDYQAK